MEFKGYIYEYWVAEALVDWLMSNSYVYVPSLDGRENYWANAEGEADWDAVYDEVWCTDEVVGNGPMGHFPYEDEGALFSAVKHIDFERFWDFAEEFGVDAMKIARQYNSWKELAECADSWARLEALGGAIGLVKTGVVPGGSAL